MRYRFPLVAAAVLFGIPVPGIAQEDFRALLSGEQTPLTLKLGDLNSTWRRVAINGGQDSEAQMMAMTASMFGATAHARVYFTTGETRSAGGQSYLVTYRTQPPNQNWSQVMRMGQAGQFPPIEKLGKETRLHLVLLNTRQIGGFSEIRPFSLEREIAESEKAATEEAEWRQKMMGAGMFGGPPPGVADAVPAPDAPVPPKATPGSKPKPRVKTAPAPPAVKPAPTPRN